LFEFRDNSINAFKPGRLLLFVLTQKVNKKLKAVIKIANFQLVMLKILETPFGQTQVFLTAPRIEFLNAF